MARETWEEKINRIRKMTTDEFVKFVKAEWKRHEDTIECPEESKTYSEFYEQQRIAYGRSIEHNLFTSI